MPRRETIVRLIVFWFESIAFFGAAIHSPALAAALLPPPEGGRRRPAPTRAVCAVQGVDDAPG